MPKRVYVSPDGLASCPQCLSHVRVEDEIDETVCPFCDNSFHLHHGVTEVGSSASTLLRNSRTGIMIAAFAGAGLTMTVACGEEEDDEPDPAVNLHADYGGFAEYDHDVGVRDDGDTGIAEDATTDADEDTDGETDAAESDATDDV